MFLPILNCYIMTLIQCYLNPLNWNTYLNQTLRSQYILQLCPLPSEMSLRSLTSPSNKQLCQQMVLVVLLHNFWGQHLISFKGKLITSSRKLSLTSPCQKKTNRTCSDSEYTKFFDIVRIFIIFLVIKFKQSILNI